MNQTAASAPGASLLPDTTDLFTATHLVFIAVLAVLVIAGIVFGARLSRRRRQARAELEEHNTQVEQHTPPAAAVPPPPAPETREHAPSPVPAAPAPSPAPSAASPAVVQIRPEPPRPVPAPAVEAVQPTGPSHADGPITQLKGLGPKVATRLGELGITTVGHLAALTDDEAQAIDTQLGPFMGRMGRDRWQEQSRFLAAGDVKGFEAVFGRL